MCPCSHQRSGTGRRRQCTPVAMRPGTGIVMTRIGGSAMDVTSPSLAPQQRRPRQQGRIGPGPGNVSCDAPAGDRRRRATGVPACAGRARGRPPPERCTKTQLSCGEPPDGSMRPEVWPRVVNARVFRCPPASCHPRSEAIPSTGRLAAACPDLRASAWASVAAAPLPRR
jgi:hypothetical protein